MNQIEIINKITLTEFFLFCTTLLFLVMWLMKREKIKSLTFHLMDARSNAHMFYTMYIELSNSSLDIVNRWQKSQEDNKILFEKVHSANKNN